MAFQTLTITEKASPQTPPPTTLFSLIIPTQTQTPTKMCKQEIYTSQCVCPAQDTPACPHNQHIKPLPSSTTTSVSSEEEEEEILIDQEGFPLRKQGSDDFELIESNGMDMEDPFPFPSSSSSSSSKKTQTRSRKINLPNLKSPLPNKVTFPSSFSISISIPSPKILKQNVGIVLLGKSFLGKVMGSGSGMDKNKNKSTPSSSTSSKDNGEPVILKNFEEEIGLLTLEEQPYETYTPLDLEPEVFVPRN